MFPLQGPVSRRHSSLARRASPLGPVGGVQFLAPHEVYLRVGARRVGLQVAARLQVQRGVVERLGRGGRGRGRGGGRGAHAEPRGGVAARPRHHDGGCAGHVR